MNTPQNILITGSAKRIGAACARLLHAEGYNIIIHYHSSEHAAQALTAELNAQRPDSVVMLQADLLRLEELENLAQQAKLAWGGVDVLVNNASLFYPQTVSGTTEQNWDELLGSNLKAPFFLAKALENTLRSRRGCIVNMVDIHSERGLLGYPVCSIGKGGLEAMTRILAKEFAPEIRVNGVSPGAILWAEHDTDPERQADIMRRIALKRLGDPLDIAKAVRFLIKDADYITGQIIKVDGGRTLNC
ncbi:MAG: pteridine reductase [Methylococcaceae bacterium]|nr:pteridine reductase [Methylococcaceae bacterium]